MTKRPIRIRPDGIIEIQHRRLRAASPFEPHFLTLSSALFTSALLSADAVAVPSWLAVVAACAGLELLRAYRTCRLLPPLAAVEELPTPRRAG